MNVQPKGLARGVLALLMVPFVAACATTEDVQTASKQSLEKTEEVRASLESKIEQINRIQRQAEEQQAALGKLLKQAQSELTTAQQRGAELETRVQEIKGQDMSVLQGQLETIRRDLDGLQSGLDDQKARVFSLEKMAGRLDGFEKRADLADKSLAQVTETVKAIGTKLSSQVDHQAQSLAKLGEAMKQADAQARDLSAKVAQSQAALAEFASRTEGKVGVLAVQESDRAAKVDALRKQLESDGQAMRALAARAEQQAARLDALEKTLNAVVATVNETSGSLGELKRVLEESIAHTAVPAEAPPEASPPPLQQAQPAQRASIPTEPSQQAGAPPRTTPEAALSAQEAYERAKAQYDNKQYHDALAAFSQFLNQYPHATQVPSAHFWMAECYVKTRDIILAIKEYEYVIKNYPQHQKAPGALLHKADALLEMNDKVSAKNTYKQVIEKYSGSEEAKRAHLKLASLK
jgi:tol-pal system protein YbgF